MAESENIGGVSIGITGDYSGLQSDFDKAVAIAVAGGATLAQAIDKASQSGVSNFNEIGEAAKKFGYDFIESAQKIIDKQKALDAELVQAKGALVDIRLAYEQGAASAEVLARAEENLEAATKKAAGSLHELKPALEEAKTGFEKFAEGVGQWVEHPLKSAGEAAKGFITAIGPIGAVALAAVAGVAKLGQEIVALVLAEGAAAEKTQNFADRLQLSFQDTKKLSEMAEIAGVNISVLERASQRLSSAFYDYGGAGKKVAEGLDLINIAADGTGDTLVKVLKHLASLPDAGQRIAEAHKIMGRGAIELEPLLKNYAALQAAVEALGGNITSEMISALTRADDAAGLLGIAWRNLKTELAAAFAPAVTGGLELLTKLISTPGPPKLEEQIHNLNSEINRLKLSADSATVAVAGMMGGGFTAFNPKTQVLQLEAQARFLEGQRDAIARSKEYNDELDKSNRAAQIWIQNTDERAKAAADAAHVIARARWEENQATVALQKAEEEQSKRLIENLKFFHVALSDPAVENAKQRMAELIQAHREGKVSLHDLTEAQADFNKVFGYDFASYAEKALALIEQMDQKWQKLSQSIEHQRDLLRSPEFSDRAKAMLAEVNASVPFDPDREARMRGTPLGDALLRAGVDRDTGQTKNIIAITDALKSQEATLLEVEAIWARSSGDIQRLAKYDLPAASAAYREMIEVAKAHGASIGRVMQLEQERLRLIIQEKTLRGESTTAEIIAHENIRILEEAQIERSQRWGKLYVDLVKNFHGAFQTLGDGIVDAITGAKSWHDAWHDSIKRIATMFLDTLVGTAMKAVSTQLLKLITESDGLFGSLSKVARAIGLGGAASGAGGQGPTGGAGGSGGAGGAGDLGSALGSLSGALGVANLGVAVASGITTGIQLARIESDVAKIEISTRQTKEQLTGGIQFALNTWLPKLDYLSGILGALTTGGAIGQIRDILWYGKINVNVVRGDAGTGNANDVLTGGMEPGGGLPAAGPSTPGDNVDPTKALVANAVKLGRGFADLNTSIEKIVKAAGGYELKPGESFGGTFTRQAELTTAQGIAAGARATGLTPEQFKGLVDAQFKAHPDWFPKGTQPSDIYQPSFGTFAASTDPMQLAEEKAKRAALEAYRAGTLTLAEYNRKVQEATDSFQRQVASVDTLTSQLGRMTDIGSFEAKALIAELQARGATISAAGTRGITPGYFGGGTPRNEGVMGVASPSLGPGPILPKWSESQISDATSKYAAQLQNMAATRDQQNAAAGAQLQKFRSDQLNAFVKSTIKLFDDIHDAPWVADMDPETVRKIREDNPFYGIEGKRKLPTGFEASVNKNLGDLFSSQQGEFGRLSGGTSSESEFRYAVAKGQGNLEAYLRSLGDILAAGQQELFRAVVPLPGAPAKQQIRSYAAAPVDYAKLLADYNLNLRTETTGPGWGGAPIVGMGGNSTRTIVIQAFDPASRAIGRGLVDELANNGIYR